MKLSRRLHHWWARHHGYFWLPCERCGFEFGGHEKGWQPRHKKTGQPLLCASCASEDRVRAFMRESFKQMADEYDRKFNEYLARIPKPSDSSKGGTHA